MIREILEFVVTGRTNDLDDLREDMEKTAQAVDDYGDSAETSSAKSAKAEKGIFNLGKAAGAALSAIKALTAVGLAAFMTVAGTAVHDVLALDSAMNKFEAQTGITGDALTEYTDIAQGLYASNLGESMDDVVTALGQVRNISGASGDALATLTEKGLILRDVFGYDIAESMRAADNASKAFGVDASQVFDFVTVAAQRTGDASGDLLDTVNEYGADFAEAGYSVDQMFAALIQGSDAGIFNLDKIGDSVREFGTRVQEGTDDTKAAFDSLLKADTDGWIFKDYETGVDTTIKNSKELYAAIEAGTVPLSLVGDRVAETLSQIEDPIERNSVGVALLGSMYEDLGPAAFEALNIMDEGLEGVEGATDRAGDAMQRGLGPAWQKLTRTARMGLVTAIEPYATELIDELVPIMEDLGEWLTLKGIPGLIDFFGTISGGVQDVLDFTASFLGFDSVKGMFTGLADTVGGLIDTFSNLSPESVIALGAALALIAGPSIVAGITGLAGSLLSVLNTLTAGAATNPALLVALGLIAAYETDFGGLKTSIDDMGKALQNKEYGNAAKELGNAILAIPKGIATWIGEQVGIDVPEGLSAWSGVVDQIGIILEALPGYIDSLIEKATGFTAGEMWTAFKTTLTTIGYFLSSLPGRITDFVASLAVEIPEAWETFKGIVTSIKNVINLLPGRLVEIANNLGISLPEEWSTFEGIAKSIKDFIGGIPAKIAEFVGALAIQYPGVWDTFKGIVSEIKGAFEWVRDNVVKIFTDLNIPMPPGLEALKGALDTILGTITGIVEGLKGMDGDSANGGGGPSGGGGAGFGAKGAKVKRGERWVVGEEGWEFFIPDLDGEIIPHDESVRMLKALQESQSISIPQMVNAAFAMPAFGYSDGGNNYTFHGPMNFLGVQNVRQFMREFEDEKWRQNRRG